jgi:Zn-finger nucleic acid-binding protein
VYCRAAIATVHCSRCFHLNAAGSQHCSTCGNELGRALPDSPSAEQCPVCKAALTALDSDRGRLFDCARCDGKFVPHTVLLALLARAPANRLGARLPKPANPLEQAVVYRACPTCGQLMHRKNFGERSGVIVDLCSLHGTWFDREELPRVLAFVENGGLERAERARTSAGGVGHPVQTSVVTRVVETYEVADGAATAVEVVLEIVGSTIDWLTSD